MSGKIFGTRTPAWIALLALLAATGLVVDRDGPART